MKEEKKIRKETIVSGIVAGVYMAILTAVFVLVPGIRKSVIGSWGGLFGVDLYLIASSIVPALCLFVGRMKEEYSDNSLTYVGMLWYLVLYLIKSSWLMDYKLLSLGGIFCLIVQIIITVPPIMIICWILTKGGINHKERPSCYNCMYLDIDENYKPKNKYDDYWCPICDKYVKGGDVCEDYSHKK